MKDISTEQKLELVHQIRAQYNRNQFDMNNRERILYGRGMNYHNNYLENESDNTSSRSTFTLRLFMAALLFLFIIALDKSGNSFAGMEITEIFTVLSENVEIKGLPEIDE